MRVLVFINQLGFGGSEKAACRWACNLVKRGHELRLLSLLDGPRRAELEACGIAVQTDAHGSLQRVIEEFQPDVIHAHAPGHAHQGDMFGETLGRMPKKIPVVQTNIFGQLENPKENQWTDFRLFISWTSCVQAARRNFMPLNHEFFRHASVAVYPVDPDDGPSQSETNTFRLQHGIGPGDILIGRLSRPEPNKWADLALDAFRLAATKNSKLKLLLREPPPFIAERLAAAPDKDRFVILPATSDANELARTIGSLDVVLHTSSIGESFGYGIAEPMNYGKPVITNSTPWLDQAQIELVRQGECGFVASTAATMAQAILKLADDVDLRKRLGENAKAHIRKLADPTESTDRLEATLQAAVTGEQNPFLCQDIVRAKAAADYLDEQQFGHSLAEQLALRPRHYRVRIHQWRKAIKRKRFIRP